VVIKDHCPIYSNYTILPGAVLEEGAVLAAGSVLKGRAKPWSVYASACQISQSAGADRPE